MSTLQTKSDLKESTIEKLQTLIRYNIDSYNGFAESAKEIDHDGLSKLFNDLAAEHSSMAKELQNHVEWNNEEPEDDGSTKAKIHRIWINVRGKLNSGDPRVILEEAERGEDAIKEAYENVLEEVSGTALNDVLVRQYASVKTGHDKVRDLRDTFKSS